MKPGFAIQTKNGNSFDPKTGTLDKVDVDDIAHALSNLCRYAGHCRHFYSVAEHSVLTYNIAKKLWPDDLDAQLAALMHDATEAYVGDIPTPLKVLLPEYEKIEEDLAVEISAALKIPVTLDTFNKVKQVDREALATEAPLLFEDTSHWDTIRGVTRHEDLVFTIMDNQMFPMFPEMAAESFLGSFYEIMDRRKCEKV